jgi:hypothetical protein
MVQLGQQASGHFEDNLCLVQVDISSLDFNPILHASVVIDEWYQSMRQLCACYSQMLRFREDSGTLRTDSTLMVLMRGSALSESGSPFVRPSIPARST